MLRIDLAPFRTGMHYVALEPEAQALALDPDRFMDIRVDVALDVLNDRVLATLHATATAVLECDRTLALFEHPLEGDCRILFAPPSWARSHDDEEDPGFEEVRILPPSNREVDLTDAVRDTLLLAIPARKVAPGAEDLEIPSVFGAPSRSEEAAIDPRWEALRSLKAGDGAQG